ncbi:MAG: AsmA family protein [Pseudomonadota bacterium]|nr:AsmA family protein [Pseudomonadota bacterium]
MMAVRILKIIAATLLSVCVLLVLALWLVDFGFLKPKVESTVSDLTGREFRIDGELSLHLLPMPTLVIEKVSLSNAEWASEPVMLQADKAYVRMGLLSWRDYPIVINRIELQQVALVVEAGPNQQVNWSFPFMQSDTRAEESKPKSGGLSIPVVVRSADIQDVRITYRQPQSQDQVIVLESIAATVDKGSDDSDDNDDDSNTTRLQGKLQFQDWPMQLSAAISEHRIKAELRVEKVDLNTQIDFPEQGFDIDLAINSLAELGALLELEGLPDAAAKFNGKLNLGEKQIEIPSFQVTLGDSDLAGAVQIELTDPPRIEAQTKSTLLDLTSFLPADNGAEAPGSAESTSTKRYVFDDTPLPMGLLRALNLKLDVDIDRLLLRNTELKQFQLSADARKGKLSIKNRFSGYLSGSFASSVNLDASADEAKVNVDSKVRDVRLAVLSGAGVPKEDVPITNLNILVESSGATARELAANLEGGVALNQGAGKVNNDLIQRFSGDILSQLFTALNPFMNKQEFTRWECSMFALRFTSGFGEIKGFLLQSDQLTVVGGGDIDLNSEALNIEFNTKPRTGVGVSADMFVTPFVKLGGTLAQPSVGLNRKGVLLSGGAAVLTGGMSFLYTGIMDRATASADHCDEARAVIEDAVEKVEAKSSQD